MNSLDRAVNTDFLVVSKSLLPYLSADRQKPIAIFIKVMELIYTVNLFSNETSVRSMSRTQDTGWEKDFLNDVKSNLSQDKAYFIDAIMKLTEARNLLAKQPNPSEDSSYYPATDYHMHPADSGIPENQNFPDALNSTDKASAVKGVASGRKPASSASQNPPNPEQLINSLSSMLDPNQAQLLKLLTSFLTPQS